MGLEPLDEPGKAEKLELHCDQTCVDQILAGESQIQTVDGFSVDQALLVPETKMIDAGFHVSSQGKTTDDQCMVWAQEPIRIRGFSPDKVVALVEVKRDVAEECLFLVSLIELETYPERCIDDMYRPEDFPDHPRGCCMQRPTDDITSCWYTNGITYLPCVDLNNTLDKDRIEQATGRVWWNIDCQ